MTVKILIGDVRARLAELPDESAHCVVTSPPYWGLRDYGVEGQMGMEPTLGEHIAAMVKVFAEVRRVLRKDGTLWLNYRDCYATTPNGRSAADTKAAGNDDRTFRDKPFSTIGPIYDPDGGAKGKGGGAGKNRYKDDRAPQSGRIVAGGNLKPKDLCMIPNRLAIALQEDGWWVRSEIIWHKPNPMPESVTDRPACSHEKVFMLTKSQRYWYDAEAVRRPMAATSIPSHGRRHAGFNDRWDAMEKIEQTQSANLRNVWTIATAAFSEAHFATFPPALVEPCIKAGCPAGGTVLDPFGGAGTTGLVADRLGRNAILIELNPEYARIAEQRIRGDAPMFTTVDVT